MNRGTGRVIRRWIGINIKKIIKYTGNIISILTIIYIFMAVKKLDFHIAEIGNKVLLFVIAAVGAVIAVIGLFLQSYAWKIPLELFLNKKISFTSTWPIYLKANLGKYLPGNVLHFVERNLFAYDLGLSQFFVALSSVLEVAVMVVTALLISIVFGGRNLLILLGQIDRTILAGAAVIGVTACVAAVFVVWKFSDRLSVLWERIRGADISFRSLRNTTIKMSGCYTAVLFSNGLCFALICRFVVGADLTPGNLVFLTICYILAWLAGYCIPGAPGGIGVREFVLVILTRSMLGSDGIYLAVIVQRLISIIGDAAGYLLSAAAVLRQRHNEKMK